MARGQRTGRRGGLGFTHKWNMGWMHDTLGYFGRDSVHRRWHHNELTFGLMYAFSEHFVLPLSHDEVVHGKGSLIGKMAGDEWQQAANLRAMYAWMWAFPGSKLLFMGSELGQRSEWNADAEVDWGIGEVGSHGGFYRLLRRLNSIADSEPAITIAGDSGSFVWLDADDHEHSIYAFMRWPMEPGAGPVVCVANLTPVPREGYRIGVPRSGTWQVLVNTDDPEFGGSGYGTPSPFVSKPTACQGQAQSIVVTLPPLSVMWLASDSTVASDTGSSASAADGGRTELIDTP